uniref:Uncharacterized protein LOC111116341 n=1 Tax=Crassostrea virginica TaxID=6565 RepID=A0A8B8C8B0_CRAVI|nr:uncharacterized protein LOC111116341 [Crassostrea virginica]
MKVTVILFFVQFTYMRFETNSSKDNMCKNGERETCCSGYYEMNGTCLECLGAYGFNCSLPCADVTYGYQCKNKCTCAYNEVCDKYRGCVRLDNERESNRINDQLILLIGFGSTTLSLSLIFVGVMFYRWRVYIQRNFPVSETNKGFQTNVLPISNNEEIQLGNYVDARESTMLEICTNTCTRESVDYRRNSAEYNHLFGLTNVNQKSVDKHTEDNYSTVDARFRQKGEHVAFSEFPGDDCYVSMSKNAKRSNRLSKSCSDLRIDVSKVYSYCRQLNSKMKTSNENMLIEHL